MDEADGTPSGTDIDTITAETDLLILHCDEELKKLQEKSEFTNKRKRDIETTLEASVANQNYAEAAELKTLLNQVEADFADIEGNVTLGLKKKRDHELKKMKIEQEHLMQSLEKGCLSGKSMKQISHNAVRSELDKIVLENKDILKEAVTFFRSIAQISASSLASEVEFVSGVDKHKAAYSGLQSVCDAHEKGILALCAMAVDKISGGGESAFEGRHYNRSQWYNEQRKRGGHSQAPIDVGIANFALLPGAFKDGHEFCCCDQCFILKYSVPEADGGGEYRFHPLNKDGRLVIAKPATSAIVNPRGLHHQNGESEGYTKLEVENIIANGNKDHFLLDILIDKKSVEPTGTLQSFQDLRESGLAFSFNIVSRNNVLYRIFQLYLWQNGFNVGGKIYPVKMNCKKHGNNTEEKVVNWKCHLHWHVWELERWTIDELILQAKEIVNIHNDGNIKNHKIVQPRVTLP